MISRNLTQQAGPPVADQIHFTGTQWAFADVNAEDGANPVTDLHAGKAVYPFGSCGQLPDDPDIFPAAGICKITAVAYPAEAFREDVHEEAADEFLPGKPQRFYFAAVAVVLV